MTRHGSASTIETALGLWTAGTARSVDVAAGAGRSAVAVADGMAGHCTGWLGARLAVRTVVERLGGDPVDARFTGAAEVLPDDWGWEGAAQQKPEAERLYDACVAAVDEASLSSDGLRSLFAGLDRALAVVPPRANIHSVMTSCVAVQIDGARVRGVHAGVGRAFLLRDGSPIESLVVPHFLHLVGDRLRKPEAHPELLPRGIAANGVGSLESSGIGVDVFEVELRPNDLLFLCAYDLEIPDDELGRILRPASVPNSALGAPLRTLEQHAAAVFAEERQAEIYGRSEWVFALLRAR